MKIAAVSGMERFRTNLEALGLSGEYGLEQLIGAARVAGPELADFLGVSLDDLVHSVDTALPTASAIPQSALETISHATYSLGVAIDRIPHLTEAPDLALPAAAPPANVSLVPGMPPIRNQGTRGTCVAHAALAMYEHQLNTQAAFQDLSEQFLYWNCKRNDGIPNEEGTWLAVAVPLLQRDGCCLETTWQYQPNPISGNEGQGPPPGGAQLEALTFRVPSVKQLSPTSVDDIKNELAGGRCVAFSIPVFNSWYRSTWVAFTGDITMPVPGEIRVGGHAMCLVGYTDLPNLGLGGGRFILRNSWGTNWGTNSSLGPGYGTIPYAYIAKMGTEAYSIG